MNAATVEEHGSPGAPQTVGELGELALIEAIQRLAGVCAGRDVILGIGDDAAVVHTDRPLVVTTDAIREGADWLPSCTPPEAIGHRAVAVNLSDLAAMGATPRWMVLSLLLPSGMATSDLLASLHSAVALAGQHGCTLIGGDVDIGGEAQVWSLTAMGVLEGQALQRSAARPEDRLWLVGEVGLAALGLWWLQRDGQREGPPAAPAALAPLRDRAVEAHLRPTPWVEVGRALARAPYRVGAIDVSDGLSLDARRLATASNVGLALSVPRPPWVQGHEANLDALGAPWRESVVGGGDDYALLVAADPRCDVSAIASACGAPCVAIGHATPPGELTLRLDEQLCDAGPRGYLHGRAR